MLESYENNILYEAKRPNKDEALQLCSQNAKCLGTIEGKNLWMLDLPQQMSAYIIDGKPKEPGKRSRLWLYKDTVSTLLYRH